MILFSKFRFNKYIAITIFPFIIINKIYKGDLVLVNHEKIHIKQQIELLWIPFFIWYFVEFLIRLIQYKNWNLAYRNISFEREAYQNEHDFEYLKNRKIFGFIDYL
jgi:hypothetical protein